MSRFLIFSFLIFIFTQCRSDQATTFAEKVENAHHKTAFLENKAIQFDILLNFGGKTRLNGKMTLLTDSRAGIIEENNANRIFFENGDVFIDTTFTDPEGARFTAFTWSYFFLMPYKLSDPGTQWQSYENKNLNGKAYEVEKLTFDSGTGDAPDDWYIVYADPETQLMHAAAYIVTAKKTVSEAEKDPHAIVYENYKEVAGVPIARRWVFHGWTKEEGLTEELGWAELAGIEFIDAPEPLFFVPQHYIKL